ncbi:MAG: hypothetical protein WB624_03870 [Xanthobacteraceae bacterium]
MFVLKCPTEQRYRQDISKPLLLDRIGRMIELSAESADYIGDELSPFLDCHSKEASQDLRNAGGTGICRVTFWPRSDHVRFE